MGAARFYVRRGAPPTAAESFRRRTAPSAAGPPRHLTNSIIDSRAALRNGGSPFLRSAWGPAYRGGILPSADGPFRRWPPTPFDEFDHRFSGCSPEWGQPVFTFGVGPRLPRRNPSVGGRPLPPLAPH